MIDFDPLTADMLTVYRYRSRLGVLDDDCNCHVPPEARHHETCSVTPIYASTLSALAIRSLNKVIQRIYDLTVGLIL